MFLVVLSTSGLLNLVLLIFDLPGDVVGTLVPPSGAAVSV